MYTLLTMRTPSSIGPTPPIPPPMKGVDSFVIDEAVGGGMVLHPSALEVATSAMEVMAVAARNAALLIADQLAA